MARRNQLKGIAGNLVQWCLSRNFDFEGYWAIGQLYKYAEDLDTNRIILNLKNKTLTPASDSTDFKKAIESLSKVLKNELQSNKIPEAWLKEVSVIFSFNEAYQDKYHYWGSALGKPFICVAEITTDLVKTYIKESGCNIWVHNPKKESCRNDF